MIGGLVTLFVIVVAVIILCTFIGAVADDNYGDAYYDSYDDEDDEDGA